MYIGAIAPISGLGAVQYQDSKERI